MSVPILLAPASRRALDLMAFCLDRFVVLPVASACARNDTWYRTVILLRGYRWSFKAAQNLARRELARPLPGGCMSGLQEATTAGYRRGEKNDHNGNRGGLWRPMLHIRRGR
jgi:hypothetical protein